MNGSLSFPLFPLLGALAFSGARTSGSIVPRPVQAAIDVPFRVSGRKAAVRPTLAPDLRRRTADHIHRNLHH